MRRGEERRKVKRRYWRRRFKRKTQKNGRRKEKNWRKDVGMWKRGEEYKTSDDLIKNYIFQLACTELRVSQGCQLRSRWCLEITSSGHLRGRER